MSDSPSASGTDSSVDAAALDAPPSAWRPGNASWTVRAIFTTFAIVGTLLVLAAWHLPPFTGLSERTEDAYVQGHTTVVAPQVSGYVRRVLVDDFVHVHEGDVVVEIDPRTLDQEIAQKRAVLDAREADLANNRQKLRQGAAAVRQVDASLISARAAYDKADADARRSTELVVDGSLSEREHDADISVLRQSAALTGSVRAQRESAVEAVKAVLVNEGVLRADVEAARAQWEAALVNRSYATIRAPQGGDVSEVGVRLGQFVVAGAPLMYVVPVERWVIANYKETQIHRMRPGQPAWVTVDALDHARLNGRVERIAPATGAQFSPLKPDNATGNFTKVPQRIPVRIALDANSSVIGRLRPGMSVEAHVETGDPGGLEAQ